MWFIPGFPTTLHKGSSSLLALPLVALVAMACPAPSDSDATDAGNIDAQTDGGNEEGDSGPADAGPSAEDGGPEPGCTLDPVLGSLALGEGYEVVAHSPLNPEYAFAGLASPDGQEIYAVVPENVHLWHLGAFPWTENSPTDLGSLVADGDLTPFPSYFLAAHGNLLAAGYTTSFEDPYPGRVVVIDTAGTPADDADDDVTRLDAFANFSAAFADSGLLLVEGASLADVAAGDPTIAVYGYLPADGTTALVATGVGAASGYAAHAAGSDGIVALGGFSDAFVNQLWAVDATSVEAGFSGTPFDLSLAPLISNANMLGVAGFSGGIAFLEADENYVATGIKRHPLSLTGTTPEVHAAENVLMVQDDCTVIFHLLTLGEGLGVVVADSQGSRLVHLAKSAP
jgi:hypothetical protein